MNIMNSSGKFIEFLKAARSSIAYKVEDVILDVTEQIIERMRQLNLSKSALASKIGTSAPYTTKMLRGGTNFTLESMVKVSEGLDCDLKVQLVPKTRSQDLIQIIERRMPATSKAEFKTWSQFRHAHERAAKGNLDHVETFCAPQLYY
jgi:hypothetical protein